MQHPIILKGNQVTLFPLEACHFGELQLLAKDNRIWEFLPADCSKPETFQINFTEALVEKEKGTQYPFVITNNKNGNLIGSTRFLDIQMQHKKLEIGWTWLHPNFWRTPINLECKLLLLAFCFDTLQMNRVQLKTSDTNMRSRKAIEKLGATFEGILRKDRIRDNGSIRNSAYYSILDNEWITIKQDLLAKLSL